MEKSSEYTVNKRGGISLEVKQYCHACPDFEAEVEKERLFSERNEIMLNTIIRCKHSGRCRAIKMYLSEQEGK